MGKLLICLSIVLASLSVASAQSECIEGDCQNRKSTCIFPGGDKYVGEFKNGLLHGLGGLYFSNGDRYIGNWVKQHREGGGRFTFADGSEYIGNFLADQFQGKGTMTYSNGNRYEGMWAEGKPNGEGIFEYANGDSYEGDMMAGRMSGRGTMYYADGSHYEGEWKEGKRHGMGAMHYPDRENISGQWQNDQYLADWGSLAFTGDTSLLRNCNTVNCAEGKGKYYYRDGTKYVGDFLNGQPQGIGTVFYPGGDRYDGGWRSNEPQGTGVMHYASGKSIGAIWDRGQPTRQLFADQKDPIQNVTVDVDPTIKIWAVIVGAARYTHMPALRYTDDDAYQLFAFLKSPEGGALPSEQIRLLIDEDATHRNIIEAMRQTFLRADDNDVVLFYFSGHGLEGAFLPIDFDGFGNRLDHEEIREMLNKSRAKHKLILADACHSGSLLAARAPIHVALQRYYEAFAQSTGGTALLLSSKSEEYSLEDRGLRSGIFSYFLRRGLEGQADEDGNKIVTIRELFNFVHRSVRQYTGNVQTPTLTGNFDDAMPVSVIRN